MFLPDKAEFIFALPPTGESQDEDEEEEEGGEAGARKNKNQKKNNEVQRLSQADLKELAKGEKDIVQDLEFSDDE